MQRRRRSPTIPLSPHFGWALAARAPRRRRRSSRSLGYHADRRSRLGVGVWGMNIPFVWGFDLINYAWWIGIANGASLFAAILVLRRHDLRTAVNRFAEAVALFAVDLRRHLPDPPSRPALAVLLDRSLSGDLRGLAAVPQHADLGFLGHQHACRSSRACSGTSA